MDGDDEINKKNSLIEEMSAKLQHVREVRNKNIKNYLNRNPEQRQKANKRASLAYIKKSLGIDVKTDPIYLTLETDEERDLYLKYLIELERQDR
jgi:hypothetical protein